jgi:FixJ family two-component response regulator
MSAEFKDAVANAVTAGASEASVRRRAGRGILIVEDNHFVARQAESVLMDAGYEVVDIVATADDAVRVALERRPQLVLMDIYLPGKRDGVAAAIEIFKRCGVRSIFASAPADPAAEALAATARPLAWLPKPFSAKKLLATVESGIANVECTVRAMKSGAVEFLTKPLRDQELLDAVQAAIERDRGRRQQAKVVAELQERFMALTAREREVLPLVVAGRQNKQIAHELNLSEMTVKVHRSQVMRKMRARSLVDLLRMADRLGVSPRKS